MKKLLFTLLFLPCLLSAQSQFTVYGLGRNSSPAQVYLASMQPGNGLVTEISPSSVSQGYALNPLSAIDPVNGKFYFGVGAGILLSVDLTTGLADTLVLNIPFPSYFDLMQYNCADSTLYGLYRTSTPAACFLAKIDVNTGVLTTISPFSVAGGYSLNAKSTLDPVNNIFYFSPGAGILLGLDLTTGLPVVQTNITFSGPGLYFDLMTYNCDDGIIYGVNRTNSPAALYPAMVDPATGVVTNLSNNSMGQFFSLNAMSEINPFANAFHFFNGTSFVSFDLSTGNILASPTLSFSPVPGNIYFDLIARDNCKCVLSNPNLSVAETSGQLPVRVFPNPVGAGQPIQLVFPAQQERVELRIFDLTGKLIYTEMLAQGVDNHLISETEFAAGMYTVSVGAMTPTRIVITR
ncbi:MAG: T9SS type A sorting domain-containing protein [Bacteroidia bacterium]